MDARDQPPELLLQLGIVEFRSPAAVARGDRKAKEAARMQRGAISGQWCDDRNFLFRQFEGKRVLFENGRI